MSHDNQVLIELPLGRAVVDHDDLSHVELIEVDWALE